MGVPFRKMDASLPVCSLGHVDRAFYVAKRPSIDLLPLMGGLFVKRILLPLQRFAYRRWGFSDVESQSICTSRHRAEQMVKDGRWAIQELPVNVCLPDETCQFGYHDYPLAKAGNLYTERRLKLQAVPPDQIGEIEELAAEGKAVADRIAKITGGITRVLT
jgi:hypothetical protein